MRRRAGLAMLALAVLGGCTDASPHPSRANRTSSRAASAESMDAASTPAHRASPIVGQDARELSPGYPYRGGADLDASVHPSVTVDAAEQEAILAQVADLLATSTGEPYSSLRIDIDQAGSTEYQVLISGRLANATGSDEIRLRGPLGGLSDGPGDADAAFRAVPDVVIPWLVDIAAGDPKVAAWLPLYVDPVRVEWYPDAPGVFRLGFSVGGCDLPTTKPAARACTSFMHVTVDAVAGTVLLVEFEVVPV